MYRSVMRIGLVECLKLLRLKFDKTNDLKDGEVAVFNQIVEVSFAGQNRKMGELFARQDERTRKIPELKKLKIQKSTK